MKTTLLYLPLLLAALMLGLLPAACSDGDTEEEPIVPTELPAEAKTLLDTYFTGYEIVQTIRNNDTPVTYEVWFRGGGKVKFDAQGRWYEAEADRDRVLPTGFYPLPIDTYVAANYSGAYIDEIDREPYGYDVDLNTGVDLRFNADGAFLGINR